MAHRWLIVVVCALVVASTVPLYRDVGLELHAGRGRVAVPGLAAAAGGLEPGGHAVAASIASPATCSRRCRASLAVQGNAGLTGGGQGSEQQRQRVRPAEADRGAPAVAAGTDDSGAPAGAAVSARSRSSRSRAPAGSRSAGGRGAQIQYALVGPDLAKLDQYSAKGTQVIGPESDPGRRRSQLPARAAGAAPQHRPQARGRSRRARAGHRADRQRAHRRPGGHAPSTPRAISTKWC